MKIELEVPKRKPNRTIQQKALAVIEALSSDDFCQELEVDRPDDLVTKKLLSIYMYSHIGLGGCEHKDWEEELLRAYKQFKKLQII